MSSLQGKLSALVLCATALVFCNSGRADLVTNGGFETGDFTGWTQTGSSSFDGVQAPRVLALLCTAGMPVRFSGQ
jgi:hypothetical protein